MKKLLVIFTLLIVTVSCNRWKVNDLQTTKVTKINSTENGGYIDLMFKNDQVLALTFKIFIYDSKIIIADNRQKCVMIFDSFGKIEKIIGNQETIEANEKYSTIEKSFFNFGTIGEIAMDGNMNLYVQNRIVNESSKEDFSPSFIIVFNSSGELQYTLGQNGNADLPFYYIDSLFTDKKNNLIVVSKNFQTWSIYRFKDRNRDAFINFKNNKFIDAHDDKKYTGRIENIMPFNTQDKLLISIAYYDEIRFKYRKMIEYNLNSGENEKGNVILNLPNPKNELFGFIEDQYIMVWDVENDDIKFSIWNFQESIINNKRISLPKNGVYFQDICIDEKGSLYSVSVKQDSIEIQEWE